MYSVTAAALTARSVPLASATPACADASAEAAVDAARLRFRPILMTSFAFILGVYPLVVAEGAGAASRRALGTAVFGGMIASTVLAVFFVPVFFVVFQALGEWRRRPVATRGKIAGTRDLVGAASDGAGDVP